MTILRRLVHALIEQHGRRLDRRLADPRWRQREDARLFQGEVETGLDLLDVLPTARALRDQPISFVHYSETETGPAHLDAVQMQALRSALQAVSSLPPTTREDLEARLRATKRGRYAGMYIIDPSRERPLEYSYFTDLPSPTEYYTVALGVVKRVEILAGQPSISYHLDTDRSVEKKVLEIFLSFPGARERYDQLSGDKPL